VEEVPKTKVIKLELLESQVQLFREIKKALGHDESEQTFNTMINLLYAAMSLTSREQSKVKMYTRDPSKLPNTIITCPYCDKQFYPQAKVKGQDDGFREIEVDLR
jgi:hypothetical protein